MKISKEQLAEFKAIWKEQFGEEISDQYALESATKLLTLVGIVYRVPAKEGKNSSMRAINSIIS